jgi:aminoglycoside phosphotransferase
MFRHASRVQIPAQIAGYVAGWHSELVWESGPLARTWCLTGPAGEQRYLKSAPAGAEVPLRGEAVRLRWARRNRLPVPEVVAACASGEAEWLLTEALPGRRASAREMRSDPKTLVPILAEGLRRFHQAPADECPFRFGIEAAVAQVGTRVRAGLVTTTDLHPEHAHLSPAAALDELERLRPDREDLVVCHGDYCLPNVLICGGAATGFVDLGRLAVADRWLDLAIGSWSATWNLGPGWEDLFFASYGVARDDRRIAFYRLAYDLTA